MKHVIEMREGNGRAHWECDCGHGGSARAEDAVYAAEKHAGPEDQISYRHPGGDLA